MKPANANIIRIFFCHSLYRKHSDPSCRCSLVNVDVLTCKIASCEKRIYSDQLAQKHNMKALPHTLVDELTAPAKLRFIIRKMRYSCAARSEYFPVMLNELPAKTQMGSLPMPTSNFDRFCCFFP